MNLPIRVPVKCGNPSPVLSANRPLGGLVQRFMKSRKPRIWSLISLALFALIGSVAGFAGPAIASTVRSNMAAPLISQSAPHASSSPQLYRPVPEGISAPTPDLSWNKETAVVAWSPSLGAFIAVQAGTNKFVLSQYKPMSFQNGMAGTVDTGVTSSGTIVPIKDFGDSKTAKVLIVMNIVTHKEVAIMIRCGNPRARVTPSLTVYPYKNFVAGTVAKVNRTETKTFKTTCPSGQVVTVTVSAVVKGTVKGKSWGTVQGNLNLKLSTSLNEQVKLKATVKCGAVPTAPIVPAPPSSAPAPAPITIIVTITCSGVNNCNTTTPPASTTTTTCASCTGTVNPPPPSTTTTTTTPPRTTTTTTPPSTTTTTTPCGCTGPVNPPPPGSGSTTTTTVPKGTTTTTTTPSGTNTGDPGGFS